MGHRCLLQRTRTPISLTACWVSTVQSNYASMATLLNLLGKGFFPRELPPPFNTNSFAAYAPTAAAGWSNAVKRTWTRCATHNLARPGGLRRPLKIPNPISYFVLADIIASNWTTIKNHTWAVRLSASRPYVIRRSLLADYELVLNPRKTSLDSLPQSFEDTWGRWIRSTRVVTPKNHCENPNPGEHPGQVIQSAG